MKKTWRAKQIRASFGREDRGGLRLTSYRAPPRTMREFYRATLVTPAGPGAEDRLCGYTRDQRAEL